MNGYTLDKPLPRLAAIAFSLATVCALTFAGGIASPAYADQFELGTQSVSYLPDVTADMAKASYWSGKQSDPDAILADRAAIDALNEAGIEGEGTMLQPLKTARAYYYSAEQQETLKNGARSEIYSEFVGKAEDEEGNILTEADAEAILANYPMGGMQPDIASGYAIVTTHTTMRCFPTDRMLGLTPGDADDDNLYLEALRINEPLLVRAQSVDKNFLLCISSCVGASWVPAKDVAICKDKAEWLEAWDIPAGKELVVTGYKVRTEQSRVTPHTADRMLYMGTVLESVDLGSPQEALELVGTRSAYYNHVCYLPVRNDDGTYSKELALIAASDDVNEGYLPLTSANIADVAFHSLGQMYGWGGMLEANDCSGYVRDVYKCFGLELARNTTWQMNLPVCKYDLTGLDDAHKAAAIAQMPLGTVLFWGGHEMIYLGQENGKLYVISSLGSIGDVYGDEFYKTSQIKTVSINTLDMVRGNRNTWLTTLTTANIPYIPAADKGADLFDIAFYKDAIAWPKTPYVFTGKAINPKASIEGLEEDVDYEISYLDAHKQPIAASAVKNVGTYYLKISGKGAYTGAKTKAFKIKKAANTLTLSGKTATVSAVKIAKRGQSIKRGDAVSITKRKGAPTYKLAGVDKAKYKSYFKINAQTGRITVKKNLPKGTYKVTFQVKAAGDANYKAVTKKAAVTITVK